MTTAYVGTITMKNLDTGEVQYQPFTATDVDQAFWLFKNNALNNFIQAPGNANHVVAITDIAINVAGTVAPYVSLRVSGKDTGVLFTLAGLLVTINNRIPTPILIRGGSSITVKQQA